MKSWIPYIIIFLLGGFIVYKLMNPTIVEKKVTINTKDTVLVTEVHTDTLYITQYKDRFKTDTIYIKDKDSTIVDSTQIYHYYDSIININLQAKKLEWIQYNILKRDTVTQHSVKYEYIKEKGDKPLFYYGIGVGAGYGLINKKWDMFIGFSAGLNF